MQLVKAPTVWLRSWSILGNRNYHTLKRSTMLDLWKSFLSGRVSVLQFVNTVVGDYDAKAKLNNGNLERIKDFEVIFQELLKDESISFTSERLIAASLCVIKASNFRSGAKPLSENILKAAQRVIPLEFLPDISQQTMLTAVFSQLISLHEPLSAIDRAFQQENYINSGNSDESVDSNIYEKALAELQECSQSTKSNQSLSCKSNAMQSVRQSSSVSFKALEVFPCLLQLPVEEQTWLSYIDDLQALDLRFPVMRASLLNLDHVDESRFLSMYESMRKFDDWPTIAMYLQVIHRVRNGITFASTAVPLSVFSSSSVSPSISLTWFASVGSAGGTDDDVSTFSSGLLQLLRFRYANNLQLIAQFSNTMLSMPNHRFHEVVLRAVDEAVEDKTTRSLRGAQTIISEFSEWSFPVGLEQIRRMAITAKFEKFVVSDKWAIVAQMTRTAEEERLLFDILLQNGRFLEAQDYADQYGLHGLFPLINADDLSAQRARQAEAFVQYPEAIAPIVEVTSLDSLGQLAASLGLRLGFPKLSASSALQQSSERSVEVHQISLSSLMDQLRKDPLLFSTASPASLANIAGQGRYRLVVGLDSEWMVKVGAQGADGADILQIATPNATYLVNLFAIAHDRSADRKSLAILTANLLRNMFEDKSILKLGFGFCTDDLTQIAKSGRGQFRDCVSKVENLIDLQSSGLLECSHKNAPSLSDMCQRYLKKPLLKNQQTSNWRASPLSPAQRRYAALDAHTLIGVMDAALLEEGIVSGLNVARRCYLSTMTASS